MDLDDLDKWVDRLMSEVNEDLRRACVYGNPKLAENSLNWDADPEKRHDGQTAVIIATVHGHLDVLKVLAKFGANFASETTSLEIPFFDGPNHSESALMIAARNGDMPIVRFLLENKWSEVWKSAEWSETSSAFFGHWQISELLRKYLVRRLWRKSIVQMYTTLATMKLRARGEGVERVETLDTEGTLAEVMKRVQYASLHGVYTFGEFHNYYVG